MNGTTRWIQHLKEAKTYDELPSGLRLRSLKLNIQPIGVDGNYKSYISLCFM